MKGKEKEKEKEKNKIKVAVLGASGFVGIHLVRLLNHHPFFDLQAIFASEARSGKRLGEILANKNYLPSVYFAPPDSLELQTIQNFALERFTWEKLIEKGIKVIFSALPSDIACPIESELRNKGFAVFTNSAAHRLASDVPILIPEVNADHLEAIRIQQKKYGGFIVASSNCCVAGLAMSLKPLVGWGIKKVTVTTFQSISGSSRESLPAADIIGNLIPFIKDEEEKISRETVKILGDLLEDKIIPMNLPIFASCVRVPIALGHLLCVEVQFKTAPDLAEITKIFNQGSVLYHLDLPTAPYRPIIFRPESDRPQPACDVWAGEPPRSKGMAISLGRIRLQNNSLRYFLLVNNLIRGAAGNCVLSAELAFKSGYLL